MRKVLTAFWGIRQRDLDPGVRRLLHYWSEAQAEYTLLQDNVTIAHLKRGNVPNVEHLHARRKEAANLWRELEPRLQEARGHSNGSSAAGLLRALRGGEE